VRVRACMLDVHVRACTRLRACVCVCAHAMRPHWLAYSAQDVGQIGKEEIETKLCRQEVRQRTNLLIVRRRSVRMLYGRRSFS